MKARPQRESPSMPLCRPSRCAVMIEYKVDGVDVSWARQHTWLLLSFSPFPVHVQNPLHPLCRKSNSVFNLMYFSLIPTHRSRSPTTMYLSSLSPSRSFSPTLSDEISDIRVREWQKWMVLKVRSTSHSSRSLSSNEWMREMEGRPNE